MPYEIKPLGGGRSTTQKQVKQVNLFTDPAVAWVTRQPYDPEQTFKQLASNSARRGTISGGKTLSQFINFGNEQKWAVTKPRPITSQPILEDEEKLYRRNFGALEWDSLDPLSIFDQTADQAQQAMQGDPLGFLRQPADFLASKDIDLFGMEDTGLPARAADYFVGALMELAGTGLLGGIPLAIASQTPDAGGDGRDPAKHDAYYAFHSDPRYWNAVSTGTADQLDDLAQSIAAQYMDPAGNSYFVSMLRKQFDKDRLMALGLSSGNEAVDYRAIKQEWFLAGHPSPSFSQLLPTLPVIGTQIAEALMPITAEEREHWASLDSATRTNALGTTAIKQMIGEVVTTLPLLSGVGTVMAVGRTGGGAAKYAVNAYDWTLKGSLLVTEAGVGVAVANWGLSAVSPWYSETLGRRLDMARPVSGSVLAGTVNALGYWTTGSWGTAVWLKGGQRAIRQGVGRAGAVVENLGPSLASLGTREISTFAMSGGARGAKLVTELFPDAPPGTIGRGVIVSQQELTMSNLIHVAHEPRLLRSSAVLRGEKTGDEVIDAMLPEERLAYVQESLRHDMEASHANALQMVHVRQLAAQPEPLMAGPAAARAWRWARDQWRQIEHDIEVRFTRDYGPAWAARTAGAYTEEAMSTYVTKVVERLGGKVDALAQVKGHNAWLQTMRMLHQYEFSVRNGELAEALTEVESALGHKLSLVSQRHLFGDEAEASVAVLRGEDPDAAIAETRRIIEHTIEGERWFSKEWHPEGDLSHNLDNVSPAELTDYIEDVQAALLVRRKLPHEGSDTADLPLNMLAKKLDDDGAWTLAFKPENEAGEFVSYVHPRKGGTFQTPWLDYPMGNSHNIELGNRGMLGAKYDAIFRGFRTNRMSEFQRASMFRILTEKYDFTPTQIETFFTDVMTMARRHKVQPQTMGTIRPGPGTGAFADDVAKSAARVFGKGPYIGKDGVARPIDFQEVIAKSFRQSVKLNLTAGITSHMKADFGPVGHAAAWFSDIGYVWMRFHLSLLFKLGEPAESLTFNAMNGVNPQGDPLIESMFARTGVGNQHGVAMAEVQYDQAMQGLGGMADTTPVSRQARAYTFYSMQAPESMAQKQARAALEDRIAVLNETVQGGNFVYADRVDALEAAMRNALDGNGQIIPGMEEAYHEADAVLRGALDDAVVRFNNRVGPELPNDEWTLDPRELTYPSNIGSKPEEMFDPNGDLLPEDRGLWHATTNVDGVMESGLKSRRELYDEELENTPELWAVMRDLDLPGNEHLPEGSRPQQEKWWITYVRDGKVHSDLLDSSTMGRIYTSRYSDRPLNLSNFETYFKSDSVGAGQIMSISRTKRGPKLWKHEGEPREYIGLGAGIKDTSPSLTPNFPFAVAVSERLKMAIRAAKGQATGAEIIDHFERGYSEIYSDVGASQRVARRLSDMLSEHRHNKASGSGRVIRRDEEKLYQIHKARLEDKMTDAEAWVAMEEVMAAWTPEQKYKAVKILDNGLADGSDPSLTPDAMRVVLVGKWDEIARMDADKVGVVRVGIKKDTNWSDTHDAGEVRAASSKDVWVLDERIYDQPFADDKEGLLTQLRQTVMDDGTPRKGMTYRHQAILEKLEEMDRAAIPPGELMPAQFPANHGDTSNRSEMVPTSQLHQYREFDRRVEPKFAGNPGYYNEVKDHIQGRIDAGLPGIDPADPLILEYDPATNMALLVEGNHRLAIAEDLGIDALPVRVVVRQARAAQVAKGIHGPHAPLGPKWKELPDEPTLRMKPDGYIPADAKPSQIFSIRRDQVDDIEDVFGSAEHVVKVAREDFPDFIKPTRLDRIKGSHPWESSVAKAIRNPIPMKERQADLLAIETMRRDFPVLLEAAGAEGAIRVFRESGLPERDWLPHLLEDRELATRFGQTGHPDDLAALLNHAGGEKFQADFDDLYASEEWAAITGLMAINIRTAEADAFGVHFFNPYRSAIERSLNHPLTGIYPLSWSLKAARQWVKFLYNNETIAGINMHMTPAIALAQLVRAQKTAFAQESPEDLDAFLDHGNPLGSTFLIFNLIMPGDWSSIPFPASRTIRDLVRGDWDARTMGENVTSFGVFRDGRLAFEAAGELKDFVWGPDQQDPNTPWRPQKPTDGPTTYRKQKPTVFGLPPLTNAEQTR